LTALTMSECWRSIFVGVVHRKYFFLRRTAGAFLLLYVLNVTIQCSSYFFVLLKYKDFTCQ
jgi:hypothetical protein